MLPLRLEPPPGRPLSVLAVGAHPDDVEIGAGGLLLQLAAGPLQVRYVLLTGTADRPRPAPRPAPSCPERT
jgi:LmbE family N-acetylglucosaminyl deacetylase